MAEDRIGQVLAGRYRLGRAVDADGGGAGAKLFLARDVREDRRVSVAMLGGSATGDALARLASLDHPSIARVIDSGVEADSPFLVTEHFEGGTLADRFSGAAPAVRPSDVLRWLGPVAEALDHLRSEGIPHPGLVPSDVLFDAAGRAYLSAAEALSGPSAAAGEAPGAGAPDDPGALARCIYRAVAGSSPAPGAAAEELQTALAGRLPGPAADAVTRALAPKEGEQFTTATELYEAYQAGLAGAVGDYEPRSPVVRAAMIAVLVAMALAAAVYVFG